MRIIGSHRCYIAQKISDLFGRPGGQHQFVGYADEGIVGQCRSGAHLVDAGNRCGAAAGSIADELEFAFYMRRAGGANIVAGIVGIAVAGSGYQDRCRCCLILHVEHSSGYSSIHLIGSNTISDNRTDASLDSGRYRQIQIRTEYYQVKIYSIT